MKLLVLAVMLFCLEVNAHSQTNQQGEIRIGEQIPDISIPLSDSSLLRLRSLKGRFVIFDFFSVGCIVCFKSMPKLKELQQEFKGKMEFIMVGLTHKSIRKVYEKYSQLFDLSFRVAFDTVFYKKLNKEGTPYYLWMDDIGLVRAVTGLEEVNSTNIRRFINGDYGGERKSRKATRPNLDKPFLVGNNGGPDSVFLFRSILFDWVDTMYQTSPPNFDYPASNGTFQILRASVADLYNYAYNGENEWDVNSTLYGKTWPKPIFELSDSTLLGKLFGYSLTVPPEKYKRTFLKRVMKEDLGRYFGLNVVEELRPMPCWKLIANDSARRVLPSISKKRKWNYSHASLEAVAYPLKNIISTLIHRTFQNREIVLDETGIYKPIDISINAPFLDLKSVNNSLGQFGLQLIPGTEMMKVLLITDN